jgi:hypothetical protein
VLVYRDCSTSSIGVEEFIEEFDEIVRQTSPASATRNMPVSRSFLLAKVCIKSVSIAHAILMSTIFRACNCIRSQGKGSIKQ